MPGDWYPKLPHVAYAAEIRHYIRAHGHSIPIVSAGKISEPADAERLLADGQADLVGMARRMLCDPDWVRTVKARREDRILRCIYCNVRKQLDENFRVVNCFLWPRGSRQAPEHVEAAVAEWHSSGLSLNVAHHGSFVQLNCNAAGADAIGYEVNRAEQGHGNLVAASGAVAAVRNPKYRDTTAIAGLRYTYYVRPFAAEGLYGAPSNAVMINIPLRTEIAAGPL